MPPDVVHKAKEYSQDIHHNILLDWTFHHTPYGYLDRYGWLKAMTQLYNMCGTYPVKNQILFFGGNDSPFDNSALTQVQSKNIHI